MASAAGLLSPGLVSLVKRAQQLREEMDEEPTKLVAMDANSLPRKNGRRKVITWEVACYTGINVPLQKIAGLQITKE